MEAAIQKAKQGVRRYLELKGYEILEDVWCHDKDSVVLIVTDEDGALVFIDYEVNANPGEDIPEENPDSKAFERTAVAFPTVSYLSSIKICCDIVGVYIIGKGQALARQHINAITPLA